MAIPIEERISPMSTAPRIAITTDWMASPEGWTSVFFCDSSGLVRARVES
jgi:hypothetical protein